MQLICGLTIKTDDVSLQYIFLIRLKLNIVTHESLNNYSFPPIIMQ